MVPVLTGVRRITLSVVARTVSGVAGAFRWASARLTATCTLSHCLPGGLAVEPLQQTLQQNRALHRSTTEALRPAADVELYSSTALQSALHIYSSTALYTLHPLHPPSAVNFRLEPELPDARRASDMSHQGEDPSLP